MCKAVVTGNAGFHDPLWAQLCLEALAAQEAPCRIVSLDLIAPQRAS
jgi:hypothetical protein